MTPEMHAKMRRYLLDRVTEVEREEIEKAILTNDDAFEELEIAESDLVDDYVYDNLSPADRSQGEKVFFNSADAQEKVRFFRALHRYVDSNKPVSAAILTPPQRWWNQGWIFRTGAACTVVAALLISVWYVRTHRTRPESFVAITLTLSDSNRGEGNKSASVGLPLAADALRLELQLPDKNRGAYKVTLVSPSEEPLAIAEQDVQYVKVIIPSAQLKRGTYALHLYKLKPDGSEERVPGSYFFNVK